MNHDTETLIITVRNHRVILDVDLANLYNVAPKRLNEQVKRNRSRFPDDFMFQLEDQEVKFCGRKLRPQN